MRASSSARPAAWFLRLFRPWLIATSIGLAMGGSLLWVDKKAADDDFVEVPASYPEFGPRAAVQDFSVLGGGSANLSDQNFALPTSVSMSSSLSTPAFAPAAPIAAEAMPSEAALYSAE